VSSTNQIIISSHHIINLPVPGTGIPECSVFLSIAMGFKEEKWRATQSEARRRKGAMVKQEQRFDTSKPQFRKPSSNSSKIEVDDRFKTVLTDPRFQLQTVDRYGRKAPQSTQKEHKSEFNEFYSVKADENDGGTGKKEIDHYTQISKKSDDRFKMEDEMINRTLDECKDSNFRRENEKANEEDTVSRIAYLTALSRGEVDLSTSEDDDDVASTERDCDDSEDEDETPVNIETEKPGVLDPSFVENLTEVVKWTTIESPYLAVMNADWSHFRAVDIFAIISSFVPSGAILNVSVYPSNFGLKRLQKEELFGPADVWKSDKQSNMPRTQSEDDSSTNKNNIQCENNEYIPDTTDFLDSTEEISSDFDPEKLRLYEASRLKYYFAVVKFSNSQYANVAYEEVDGMEFEHSSAALDLRSIPIDEISSIIENRKLRDQVSAVPSNYNPPDYVVNALQQSNVQCTWDVGDHNRELFLTKYNVSPQAWGQMSEKDDLRAYLASDQSSDEGGSVTDNKKSRRLRDMLGLDSDNANDDDEAGAGDMYKDIDSASDDAEESDSGEEYTMEATFVPGKLNVTAEKNDAELTPWERYQLKRQQKRREKRAATREQRKKVSEERKKGKSKVNEVATIDDSFFDQKVDDINATNFDEQRPKDLKNLNGIGNCSDLDERDFDIRGVQRIEKNKEKKLTGARKRKEVRLTESVVGAEFQIDTTDKRFNAVLEGTDERFGIDRTDPNFKETPAMKHILLQQTRHRMKQRKSNTHEAIPTSGSAALSVLVTSIRSKVQR
jgi:NUC153 domain